MKSPTVFISYSHDSPEHDNRVLTLANRLREDGIDCTLDQYETSPPEGWPKWMDRHIATSDFVLVICTETYYRRVMGEEERGKGRGVKWESTLTYQHLYNDDAENTRFIPVLFKSEDEQYIPTPFKGATSYCLDLEQGYEDLYRRLTDQPKTTKPKLGKLKKLPQRERKQDFLTTVEEEKGLEDSKSTDNGGWIGAIWENNFLVYEGPIQELQLIDDQPFQQIISDVLDKAGFELYLASYNKLSHHVNRGYRIVYLTDRRSWRQKITDDGGNVLMAKPKLRS